uniref:Odorant-binding protein 19 n=1 Tax=Tropidothorax elegans TaxID=2233830 RepID=A0A2Z5EMK1_9HEMI|nr:odorant-binding protein 19 [Tropidothorax elegans]
MRSVFVVMRTLIYTAAFLFICGAVAVPQGGEPEECRPRRPDMNSVREECCKLPEPSQTRKEAFKSCREKLGIHHPHGPPPDGNPPPRPTGPPPHECLEECVFTELGALTADLQLNKDTIPTKIVEHFLESPEWNPIAQEALRTCLDASPGEIGPDSTCRSGASNFHRCFMRAVYLSCPGSLKSESDSCKEERERLEKCPNLMPKPPKPRN